MINKKETLVVLVCNVGIPSKKIGSWNIMFTDMLKYDDSVFDFIISPKPDFLIDNVVNENVSEISFIDKIKAKQNHYYSKYNFWKKIKEKLSENNQLVLNIIDDFNMVNAIHFFASKEGVRDRVKILFYFHGFYFKIKKLKLEGNFSIDKLILLTNTSYYNLLQKSIEIPFEIDILKNGIKSDFFYKLEAKEKAILREKLSLKPNVKYFLWISQDRPKKGLKIITKAWARLIEKFNDIELIIIGTKNEIKGHKINWLERKPNKELSKYYQATDFYLFSTLCHEGLPLSLIEALKSGAKCIASDIDPIREVLFGGNLGYLVDKPNLVDSWVSSVSYVLDNTYNFNKENLNLDRIYDSKKWVNDFKKISTNC